MPIQAFYEIDVASQNSVTFVIIFHYMILLCQVLAIFPNTKKIHNWESKKCSGDAYLVKGSPDF